MVIYGIASNVLTVLPMVIKGIELIAISRQRFRAVVVEMGDTRDGVEMTLPAEMSIATCRTVKRASSGFTFVGVALCAMAVGLSLEVLTWRYRDQLIRRGWTRCPQRYLCRRRTEIVELPVLESFRYPNREYEDGYGELKPLVGGGIMCKS